MGKDGVDDAWVLDDGDEAQAARTAAVVDLAARGYVTLERPPGETDVVVTIQRPWITDPDVRPWEAVLLRNVFTSPGYSTIALSALRDPGESASIREALSAELAERGFFSSAPIAVRRVGRWAAVIAAALWMQIAWNKEADLSTQLAIVATGVTLWLFAGVIAAGGLTADGRRARQSLRGFREFLLRVDRDRLEKLRAGTVDENLAWAIALGVTEGWLAPTPAR